MSLIYNATFDSQTRVMSLLDKAGNVISSCEVPRKSNGLTLTATADNSSVKLTRNGTVNNTYEVNTGSGWGSYTFDTVIKLNKGQSCKWRCSTHPTTQSDYDYVQFVMTGKIEASGNVNSMLRRGFENLTSLSGYNSAFTGLFRNCTSLVQAPKLPATTLSDSCYYRMFENCTSLTQAPELPATNLVDFCYCRMFENCTSLTQAPKLPVTNLVYACYSGMFVGCKSLTQAPELPATNLATSCYSSMFRNCTSLTKAPKLPATNLAYGCYNSMFDICSKLKEVRVAATTKPSDDDLFVWLRGVSATGNFYCDPSATIFPKDDVSGIPKNWRRLNINDYPTT